MTEQKKVSLTFAEVFSDYKIPLIENESKERVDVPLEELADLIAKKVTLIVINKLNSR